MCGTRQDDGSWAMSGHLGSEETAMAMQGTQVAIDGDLALVSFARVQ